MMHLEKEKKVYFVWVDCEMTGLDVFSEQLLEMAVIITTPDCGKVLYENSWVFSCSQDRLEKMDEWNREHHQKSGLWMRSLESSLSPEDLDAVLVESLKNLGLDSQEGILCGNSIHQDRFFLKKQMPLLSDFLHYRQLDVSTLKILWPYLRPQHSLFVKNRQTHRALDDIQESIEEYRYYIKNLS